MSYKAIPPAGVTDGSTVVTDLAGYALLAGRAGGQTLRGDTASGGNLDFSSTAHATKGLIRFGTTILVVDEANGRVGIGAAPGAGQHLLVEAAGAKGVLNATSGQPIHELRTSGTLRGSLTANSGLGVFLTAVTHDMYFDTTSAKALFFRPAEQLKLTIDAAGLTIADAVNVVLNATTGTKIGTATTQKLGFFNKAPVVQPAGVADAAGGAVIDAEARTAINAVIANLEALGLQAVV